MKFTILTLVGAAAYCASSVHADAQPDAMPQPTPAPYVESLEGNQLEERQGLILAPQATLNPAQYPSITTGYFPTMLPNVPTPTWLPVVYTQTFASVPDQLPSPGTGVIGLGTLTKKKRDIEALATGIAGRLRI